MYIADMKLFAKNEKELETSEQYTGMEFGTEKCTILIMRSRKRHLAEGIALPN